MNQGPDCAGATGEPLSGVQTHEAPVNVSGAPPRGLPIQRLAPQSASSIRPVRNDEVADAAPRGPGQSARDRY